MQTLAPRICFPAKTQCLDLIRAFCREVLETYTSDPQVHRRLVLAIDEAVANIIEHAYPNDWVAAASTIELSIEVKPDRIVARLLDHGRPFDPRKVETAGPSVLQAVIHAARGGLGAPPPPAAPRPLPRFPQRGFGLHLIRLIMDEIEYERTSGGENVLILTKHLRKGPTT